MAIALVAHRIDGSGSGNGFTSGSFDSTGANFLAVWIALGGTGTYSGTPSDNKGNSGWVQGTPAVSGLSDRCGCWWYCIPTTVGTGHTISVTGTSTFPTIAVSAWSGADTSSPYDQHNEGGLVFGTTVSTGSVTPSQNNELLLAGLQFDDSTNGNTSTGSFSVIDRLNDGSFGHSSAAVAYEIQTTATARNVAWTWTNSSRAAAGIITIKEGAVAPTITDVDTDETINDGQTGVAVTGTSMGTSNANRAFTLIQGSVSVTQTETGTGTSTAATLTIAVDKSGTDIAFGAATLRITRTSDSSFGELAVTVNPPSGQIYAVVGTPDPTSANRITAVSDIASGDQIQARGSGGGSIPTGLNIDTDATFWFSSGNTPTTFEVRVWDSSDFTWGAWATQTIGGSSGKPWLHYAQMMRA